MINISSRRSFWKSAASLKKKVVYRVKNGSAYNRSLIQRGHLTVWLSQEAIDGWQYDVPSQRGAQFLYSDEVIETTPTLCKLFGLALRQTQGFVPSLLEITGVGSIGTGYSTLSRCNRGLEVSMPVKPTDEPRHLVAGQNGGEAVWGRRVEGEATRLDPAAHLAETASGL